MVVSSRTPEEKPNRCSVCYGDFTLSPSQTTLDAPCPHCGSLVWFSQHHKQPVAILDMVFVNKTDVVWFTGATFLSTFWTFLISSNSLQQS
jgi:predicted RNA-binding Zn-ribbon protein involved in translation (DUF1610 family)